MSSAPLAGRPPYGTDERDSVYNNSPAASSRRPRPPQSQNIRPDSAYDVYDNYTDEKHSRQSGYDDLGANLLNGDMDDESDDETIAYHGDLKKSSEEKLAPYSPTNKFPGVPIVAPKPGYAAPVSALAMPEPAVSPVSQGSGSPQMAQMNFPAPLTIPARGYMGTPVPSMPHPLQAPMTPITPAFARPPKSIDEPSVKFEANNIMRGQAEETPLARRGQRGDDFWRRFSMVVKDEGGRKSTSSWLEKTQNGSASLSRMVWIVALLLIIIIGGAIGFGVYISENSKTTTTPKALGGSEDQGADLQISSSAAALAGLSSSQHVSPTLTVQKRWPLLPEPSAAFQEVSFMPMPSPALAVNHKRKLAVRLR